MQIFNKVDTRSGAEEEPSGWEVGAEVEGIEPVGAVGDVPAGAEEVESSVDDPCSRPSSRLADTLLLAIELPERSRVSISRIEESIPL